MAKRMFGKPKSFKGSKSKGPSRKGGKAPWSNPIPRGLRGGRR